MSKAEKHQQGAALIIVLWAALLLSIALAIALASVRTETRLAVAEERIFLAQQAAKDGLEFAAQTVAAEQGGRLDNLADLQFSINGYDVAFEPALESQKLDINLASESELSGFLALFVEKEIAEELAARIADWRDADDLARPNGAERREYASARNGEKIGNRSFYAVDEITQVLGMTDSLAKCILPALTVFGDGGSPSSALLTKLYGRDIAREEDRSSVQLGTSSRSASAGQRIAITATAVSSGQNIPISKSLTGAFRITGGQLKPYRWIVQFHETEEQAAECE